MDSTSALSNVVGTAAALAVSGLGWWRRWLSSSGFWAAAIVGTAVFTAGLPLTCGLLFFFLSAGMLGRLSWPERARDVTDQEAPRAAGQVLAVGLAPAAAAIGFSLTQRAELMTAGLAALAFATADTWATDIGMASPSPPRRLGFGAALAPGMSGGITLRGTAGSLAGSAALAGIALATGAAATSRAIMTIGVIGFVAALVDTLLGATVQQRRKCEQCGMATELRSHCGSATGRTGGWITNAGVNAVCSWGAAWAGWFWGSH